MLQKQERPVAGSLPAQMLEYETEFLAETVGITIEQSRALISDRSSDRATDRSVAKETPDVVSEIRSAG